MDTQNETFDSIREELKRLINQSEKMHPQQTNLEDLIDSTSPSAQTTTRSSIVSESFETINTTKNRRNSTFLDATVSYTIDDDIQKRRSDLKKSYELFQTAGEAFESINFNCLKHRIKDLHLAASQSEIDTVMQEKTVDESLTKLTDVMGFKFRQHPGEFGDIPELSSFFKACSQLQHGLEELKRHRGEMDDLGQRMIWATKISKQRSDEIEKAINNEQC